MVNGKPDQATPPHAQVDSVAMTLSLAKETPYEWPSLIRQSLVRQPRVSSEA
jgi:hypothetical protein